MTDALEKSSDSALGLTVPEGSDAQNAFLRRRIALYARVITLISFTFFVVGNVLGRVVGDVGRPASWEDAWHLVSIASFAITWLVLSRLAPTKAVLTRIDSAATLVGCAGYGLMVLGRPGDSSGLLLVLCTLATTLARAILVPSTPRRTFWLTTGATLPSLLATAWFGGVQLRLPLAMQVAMLVYILTWSVVTVALCSLASRVIYGLEAKVRAARQLGQYTLDERIGAGGMGIVYRAHHAMLKRPTAVKVLPPEKMGEKSLQRFEREVQLTSALSHPNTIVIYDYGRTPEGLFYYAMEYLEGVTLAELVDLFGPLPPARVAHIMRQAAGSIAEAHRVGLIHRDIKPENILLCERGGTFDLVKVLDFGLVKDTRAKADPTLSQVNTIVGTPQYLAPESITAPSTVGPPSDLYALGGVAYFLLVGRPVFSGRSLVEMCMQHLNAAPEPPSVAIGKPVPASMESIILSCLAKNPSDRPKSAGEIERAFATPTSDSWTDQDSERWWDAHRKELSRTREAKRVDVDVQSASVSKTIRAANALAATSPLR